MDGAFNRAPSLAVLTERDRFWLEFLHRHGPLSSHILYESTRTSHRCKDSALRRLQLLREYNWLYLPAQQRQMPKADFNPYVYDLTPRALRLLLAEGAPDHLRPTGHWSHLTGVAALAAMTEIVASRAGHTFIPASTILSLVGASLAVPLGRGRLIPDQLFAIRTPQGFRAYLLEYDRGTEPFVSPSFRKSLTRSLDQYEQAFAANHARQHYGLKAPLLALWVFTSHARAEGFKALLAEKRLESPCVHKVASLDSLCGTPRWKELQPVVASLFATDFQS